ncbi:MAG: hypothetical protein JWO19_233 [Bryobacterales bacterium]|jgi:hypothetical protein|nr:hypothetical protein [Bryobacterales bacterium]
MMLDQARKMQLWAEPARATLAGHRYPEYRYA